MAKNNERELLEQKAKELGITHAANMNDETLKERINSVEAAKSIVKELTPEEQKKKIRDEQLKLVRVIITPNTQDFENQDGVMVSVSNSIIDYTKFVPFGVESGWHIPLIVYNHLKEKRVQRFITKKVNGITTTRSTSMPAFTIVRLDDLTEKELEELKKQQLAKGIYDEE